MVSGRTPEVACLGLGHANIWGFPKIRGAFLGVLKMETKVCERTEVLVKGFLVAELPEEKGRERERDGYV